MTPSLLIEPGTYCWEASVLTTFRPLHPQGGRYSTQHWEYLQQHAALFLMVLMFLMSHHLSGQTDSNEQIDNNNNEIDLCLKHHSCYNTALHSFLCHSLPNHDVKFPNLRFWRPTKKRLIIYSAFTLKPFVPIINQGKWHSAHFTRHDQRGIIAKHFSNLPQSCILMS